MAEIKTPASRDKHGRFIKGFVWIKKGSKRPDFSGPLHPRWGQHHSEETRRKMRETNSHPSHRKGVTMEEEYGAEKTALLKDNLSRKAKQRFMDPEYRHQVSQGHKGKPIGMNARLAISSASRNYWAIEANRLRQSLNMKTRNRSREYLLTRAGKIEEINRKISNSLRQLWHSGHYETQDWHSPLKTTKPYYFTGPERVLRLFLEKQGLKEEMDWFHNKRLGRYYPDFMIPKGHLIIEVDGWPKHLNREKRDSYLHSQGWDVLHLTGEEMKSRDFVPKILTHNRFKAFLKNEEWRE